jgi:transcriptional regulator GlxA family with amidase domain
LQHKALEQPCESLHSAPGGLDLSGKHALNRHENRASIADEDEPMTRVTILALKDAATSTIIGPMDFFSSYGCNATAGKASQPCFDVEIVTTDGLPVRCLNGVLIQPHRSMLEVEKADVIIISSMISIEQILERESCAVTWLKKHYGNGAWLAAIDSGAFLLAETGLLEGKEATTSSENSMAFRRRYPDVLLKPECPVTDQGRLLCAVSANSCIDLVAHLAMKIYGYETAAELLKIHGYDADAVLQIPYSNLSHKGLHPDNPIRASREWMENNYSKPMDIEQLARMCGMSRRTFERHFKNITRETPLQYLQRIRVEKAKRMLEAGEGSFQEITYQVGYEDSCYFRRLFEKLTGFLPSDYSKKGFDRV